MKYDEMLLSKYNKTTLTREELSKELSISISTLDRGLEDGSIAIRYIRLGKSSKARYSFPIKNVAYFLEYMAA